MEFSSWYEPEKMTNEKKLKRVEAEWKIKKWMTEFSYTATTLSKTTKHREMFHTHMWGADRRSKFKASLGCIVSLKSTWATWDTVSKNKTELASLFGAYSPNWRWRTRPSRACTPFSPNPVSPSLAGQPLDSTYHLTITNLFVKYWTWEYKYSSNLKFGN